MPDHPTLEETIALLEAILDAAHDAILVVDLEGRIVRCNRQYLEMFGFTSEELARGGLPVVLERIRGQLEDGDVAVGASQTIWSAPPTKRLDLLRFKDGRVIERYLAPHQLGTCVVGRVASFRDIGEAAQTAAAVDQHRVFLEQAQALARIGSWAAELDGSERQSWSAETHRIFGVRPDEFAGTSSAFYAFVHPDDRDAVRAASAAAVANTGAYDIEHRIVRADGTVRWVHERASVVRGANGRALRMVGTVQDITEHRQLEEQLRQAQKMEAIGRLAGGIAHDLNNALTAIAGYAELALGELASEHAARADVDEIRRAAERAGSVTRQLLAFSRKQILEPRVFDVNERITGIARLLGRLLGSNVHVRTRLADTPLPVLGDPGQLEQAIINLAANARDAMPEGGELELSTSFDTVDEAFARTHVPMPPGRYVVLTVADTGHGMSPETQTHVFEPFFTTKDVGKGTGLGLSMVYGTLKQIGGFIFVDSAVNRGTTFRLYFPPAAGDVAPPVEAATAEARSREHETLLVVEDQPAVRNLVASTLRTDGYRLLLAASAEEAIAIAESHDGPIDLLLTDAIMPGRSGVELAALMVERRPALPVIIMSGYTDEAISTGAAAPSITLLQKPFAPRELRRRIREALDAAP